MKVKKRKDSEGLSVFLCLMFFFMFVLVFSGVFPRHHKAHRLFPSPLKLWRLSPCEPQSQCLGHRNKASIFGACTFRGAFWGRFLGVDFYLWRLKSFINAQQATFVSLDAIFCWCPPRALMAEATCPQLRFKKHVICTSLQIHYTWCIRFVFIQYVNTTSFSHASPCKAKNKEKILTPNRNP